MGKARQLALVCFLAFFPPALGLTAARFDTVTVDEFVDVPLGLYHHATGRFDLDRRNPPLAKLLLAAPLLDDVQLDNSPTYVGSGEDWWPWIYATRFMRLNAGHYQELFFHARLVNLAAAALAVLLLFVWVRRLIDARTSLIAAFLFATCPVLIGHASVATLDVIAATLVLGAYALFTAYAHRGSAWLALAGGFVAGMGIAAKFVVLAFLAPLVIAVLVLRRSAPEPASWPKLGAHLLMAVAMAWLALWGSYGCAGFPLPPALIEGVTAQLHDASSGELPSYVFGRWYTRGVWWYLLVALAYKLPLATLALVLVGIASFARARPSRAEWLLLIVPPLLLLYFLSFHYAKNYGVRYALPAIPFLLAIAARGAVWALSQGRAAQVAVLLLGAGQLFALGRTAPQYLSAFNELAPTPRDARRILLDSNLDWGQDLNALADYLQAQNLAEIGLAYFGHVDPRLAGIRYHFPPTRPTPGWFAVSANYLAGYPYAITYVRPQPVRVPARTFSWLDRFEPVAVVGASMFVFHVTEADLARVP